VLNNFDPAEEAALAETFATVCSATEILATEGLLAAQGRIHSPSSGA